MIVLRKPKTAEPVKWTKKPRLKLVSLAAFAKERFGRNGRKKTSSRQNLRLALIGVHSFNAEQVSDSIYGILKHWDGIPKRSRLRVVEEISGNISHDDAGVRIAVATFLGDTISLRDGFFGYVKRLRKTEEIDSDIRVKIACRKALEKIYSEEQSKS